MTIKQKIKWLKKRMKTTKEANYLFNPKDKQKRINRLKNYWMERIHINL